jgi:hypothetical protein
MAGDKSTWLTRFRMAQLAVASATVWGPHFMPCHRVRWSVWHANVCAALRDKTSWAVLEQWVQCIATPTKLKRALPCAVCCLCLCMQFAMFHLGHPNILPVGDLGVRKVRPDRIRSTLLLGTSSHLLCIFTA